MSVRGENSGQKTDVPSFGIRKAFLIPLALVAVLLALLLTVVLFAGGVREGIILAAIVVLVSLVFGEAKSRRVSFSEGGIRLRKFGRTKEVAWGGVSHVGVLILPTRCIFS